MSELSRLNHHFVIEAVKRSQRRRDSRAMVIAAEPVHSGDALVLTTVIHEPHVNSHPSPFVAATNVAATTGTGAEPTPVYKSTTDLLNPRRRFVHRDRPGIKVDDIAGACSRKVGHIKAS